MLEAVVKECYAMEPIEESPRRMLALLTAYIENHCKEGDVEPAVRRAREYLAAAGLAPFMEIRTAERLDALLRQGYLAAAENNLIEARVLCGLTDVWAYVARIRFFLYFAEIEEEKWLDEQGSSEEGIEALLAEGRMNKERLLREAREKAQAGNI